MTVPDDLSAAQPETVDHTMADQSPADQESLDRDAVEALRAAVRLPTVSHRDVVQVDRGVFGELLDDLAARFIALHAACEVIRPAGDALLLRWPGRSHDAPVVLMAHSDVVPIAADDEWAHPPFDAVLADGFVWGRGTLDCKGSLVALCVAADRLVGNGFVPSRDIWFSFGCTEEVSGGVAEAAVAELVDRGVQPWFVLDEGGAVVDDGFPGVDRPLAMIGGAEKGTVDVELRVTDSGGHASTPARGGATARLARAVLRIDRNPFPTHIPDATVQLLRTVSAHARPPLRQLLGVASRSPRVLAAALQRFGPESAAMTRTTSVVTQLQGSPGANVIAATATATVNLRVMVGESAKSAVDRIRRIVKDDRVQVRVLSGSEPSAVAPIDDAFALLERVLAATMPDVVAAPYIAMAATDSRFFHRQWPRVYRFNPFRMSRAQRGSLHNVDERIRVTDYLEGIRWYTALMESV